MRKYFLGGNTPIGFFSYYDNLIRQENAQRIYVIKGGPGTGKSTMMKKIGDWAAENGYDTDHIYCSSDPDSLDGLIIPEIKVALVDGTAPHIVDPKNPGAVDFIINLGDNWKEKNMRENKENIISTNKKIKETFDEAYVHLKVAGILHEASKKIKEKMLKEDLIKKAAGEIIFREIRDYSATGSGFKRSLFASAYTSKGYISFADTISCFKKYVILGNGAYKVTKKVSQAFVNHGYDIEVFLNPLSPENEIMHIYVPELDVGIFSDDDGVSTQNATILDLRNINKYVLEEHSEELESLRQEKAQQTDAACMIIEKAKTLHDKLESYYIPSMDFAKTLKVQEKIIEEIENLI